jgi:hypothetical protein
MHEPDDTFPIKGREENSNSIRFSSSLAVNCNLFDEISSNMSFFVRTAPNLKMLFMLTTRGQLVQTQVASH